MSIAALGIIDKVLAIVVLLLEAEPPEIRRAKMVAWYVITKPWWIWMVPEQYRDGIDQLAADIKPQEVTP